MAPFSLLMHARGWLCCVAHGSSTSSLLLSFFVVDFILLICYLLVDVHVLACFFVVEIWRGAIVPIVVLLLFQCMGVEG